jgi:hypothetical protein
VPAEVATALDVAEPITDVFQELEDEEKAKIITLASVPAIPQPDSNGEFATPAEGAKFMASFGIPRLPLNGKVAILKGWQDKASADFAQIDA